MLKAVIFDMDGVIVDTEYIDFQLQSDFIKSIAKHPEQLTHHDFSQLVGRSGRDLLERIQSLCQSDISFAEIYKGFDAINDQKYSQEMIKTHFRKDIVKIIEFAKKHGIALAIASSSSKQHILKVLKTCRIDDAFNLIVSGEDFKESKPNPAIYQFVLRQLDIHASEAIVIEDSPSGITAAKSAGIPVIAYEEKRMLVDQSQANIILPNMQAISEKIMKIVQEEKNFTEKNFDE